MRVIFTANPLIAMDDRSWTVEPMTVLLNRTVDCARRADFDTAKAQFEADVKALGRPAAFGARKCPRSRGRAFNGFDAATAGTTKVNAEMLDAASRAAA